MSAKNSLGYHGRVLILCAGVLWSLGGVFIKALDLHPLVIVFYRSLFASLFFVPFIRSSNGSVTLPLLVSTLSYTAAISAFVWANKLTTAANAIVLQYTAPIFVFAFARLVFREPVSRANVVALIAGMIGIGIIFAASRGMPDAPGVSVAILSGLLFAVYMTNLRVVKMNPALLTFANNFVCWLVLVPVVSSSLTLSMDQVIILAAMGIVQLGIPYFLFSKGLEKISLQEASLLVLIEPVLNPIWVAMAVGEVPALPTLIGGAVIVFGLASRYLLSSEKRF